MFPNPQDAKPFSSRPSLDRYRKLARSAVKSKTAVTLAEARLGIAQSHGFASWTKFASHLRGLAHKGSNIWRFETAADAIVQGDIKTLAKLLKQDPKLVHAKSTRQHAATLLIYTSANGVENYRQKSPKNIVKITKLLLDSGADIEATADVYGGGCTTLGLAATSVWPERAGVQKPLLKLLLDRGAKMEPDPIAGNKHSLITACIANGRPKAAACLADRGAKVDFVGAAALGRVDLLKKFKKPAKRDFDDGFVYACGYGQKNSVEYLLTRGADLKAHMGDGQTAAHYAVIGGHRKILKLLLPHHPPLEAKNRYGGTVLGQAMWSAAHGGDPDNYIAIFKTLIRAGAKLPKQHVPVNKRADKWLAKHGSKAESSWYWFGEGPLESGSSLARPSWC
jgi:Ankyrin repeats (3 copies)